MGNQELLKMLTEKYGDRCWDLFNFILVVRNFAHSFEGSLTKVGSLVYDRMEVDLIKNYTDLRIFQLCIEDEINEQLELIYNIKGKDFIFKVNLDRIMNRNIVEALNLDVEGILSRTKDVELRNKIISMNLIYGVFSRFKHLIIFNKKTSLKESFDLSMAPEFSIWGKKIIFTKGYVLIFPNDQVKTLMGLVYRRKIVRFMPLVINAMSVKTVRESLDNKNYNHPIWMRNLSINDFKSLKKSEIVNDILDDEFDTDLLIGNLNFLNAIKVKPDWEFFNIIKNISVRSSMFDNEYITSKKLEESLVNTFEGVVYMDKLGEDDQERVNCLNFIHTVEKQYSRFHEFFMEFRRDGRVRIYNYNYPINFQLSRFVRSTINIYQNINDDVEIIGRILDLDIWKNLGIELTKVFVFFWQKLSEILLIEISEKFRVKYEKIISIEAIILNLELEAILIVLESFAPKNLINLEDRIRWVFDNALDSILNLDFSNIEDLTSVFEKLKIGKKKIQVLKNMFTLRQIYFYKIFYGIFWIDASSNGIQLITLRLGKFNDLLLQLTNIIDNRTDCRNIYSYVTKQMRLHNHEEFLKNYLKNKITSEELNSLYNDDDNKDRIMPGSYGKGYIRARRDMDNYITEENNNLWSKLSDKEKNSISDYLWNMVFNILNNIGFDLELYKDACTNFLGEEDKIVCWYNDCKLPIIPVKEKKSRRDKLLKKEEILKHELSQVKNDKDRIILQKKIEDVKNTLNFDDKKFYKRTRISTDGSFITPRIKHTEVEIDRLKTMTALPPNSTHAYDGSNMDKTIIMMRRVGINALPIFDSLGGSIKYMSLVKVLFKLANIINIENNYLEARFPHIKIEMNKEDRVKLYRKILESSYFIR